MPRKCCCCIPLRPGVMIIAIVSSAAYILWLVSLLIHRQNLLDTFNSGEVKVPAVVGVYWACVSVAILYAISSLFGVVGAITRNRRMIDFFRILYWIMAMLLFAVTLAGWIFLMVKKDAVVQGCASFVQQSASASSPQATTVSASQAQDACSSAIRNVLIAGGFLVFVGGLFQFYFASVISSYSKRLKTNNKHERLRNLDEFTEKEHHMDF